KVGLAPRLPNGNGADYLSAPDHSSLEGMGKLTLEAWMYDELNDTSARALISKRVNYNSQISYFLYKNGTSGNLYFYIGNAGGGSGNGSEFAGTTTAANTWYHAAATFDKDLPSNRMKVYLDGVYKSAQTGPSTAVPVTTSPLYLGVMNSSYATSLKGKLDEVRISNTARSADWLAVDPLKDESRTAETPSDFGGAFLSLRNGIHNCVVF
ncbi:MAG: LamG domain-containing protein, partial [Lentisphaerae bacterium]|nr:LamG domain-containing protein [Lentisphaerota bacterium]